MKILLIAGARPNFMKIAPLVHELTAMTSPPDWELVHTGQHYDYEMSKVFFDDLDMPEPHHFLNAGPGTHAEQTARIMVEFEKVCLTLNPNVVIVVGDVNSTLACSVTAKKLNIQVAHVEAGLRSGDMSMPEEINRIVTDSISDYLFVTERSGIEHLRREGRPDECIYFVGNTMIDSLHYCLKKLDSLETGDEYKPGYVVVTLHRPSNVDEMEKVKDILKALDRISKDRTVYFPMHPRTRKNLEEFGLMGALHENIKVLPPLSYLRFLSLWRRADLVLTDSGGLQEETTALSVPCFTIRDTTERPITVQEGTNEVVGSSGDGIIRAYERFLSSGAKRGGIPELWDGHAAKRIIQVLLENLV